jgi:enoyl-[acyl-carrier protein] reductase II
MGGTASSAEFAAAASNEGALGSIGSLFRTSAAIKRDIDVVKELTNRNFAVNHIPPTLDADAFRYTLAARPAVISFALGDPGDLVRQAHDVGSKVIIQITTVAQAIEAAERGADVIIAQGGEAGWLWRPRQYDDPRPAGRRCRFTHPGGGGRRHL